MEHGKAIQMKTAKLIIKRKCYFVIPRYVCRFVEPVNNDVPFFKGHIILFKLNIYILTSLVGQGRVICLYSFEQNYFFISKYSSINKKEKENWPEIAASTCDLGNH